MSASRAPASAALLVALLACGGGVEQADRDERRVGCAKEPGFDRALSDDALSKLRAEACRTTLVWTKCESWWDYVVTACVYREEGDAGAGAKIRRVEVHSSLSVDTETSREKREAMCDAVRGRFDLHAPAFIHNSRGNAFTTCGKPRRR